LRYGKTATIWNSEELSVSGFEEFWDKLTLEGKTFWNDEVSLCLLILI